MSEDHSRRGSLGPSTVILMALWYVATWGGLVNTVMVRVKLFPERKPGTERKEGGDGEMWKQLGGSFFIMQFFKAVTKKKPKKTFNFTLVFNSLAPNGSKTHLRALYGEISDQSKA